jgi:hypothetical protein
MPSMAEGSSSAGSGDAGGSALAAGSGVGTAAAGAAWILGCGAPNIIVDRATSPGLAAGFGPGTGICGGTGFAADSPNTMVAPGRGAAAGLEGTGGFFAGAAGEGRFADGNIIVRPAASSDVGGTGAAEERGGLPVAAGCDGGFAGGGTLFGRCGAAKIAVALC